MTTREHDDLLQTHHLRIEEEEKVGGGEEGLETAKMCKQQTEVMKIQLVKELMSILIHQWICTYCVEFVYFFNTKRPPLLVHKRCMGKGI